MSAAFDAAIGKWPTILSKIGVSVQRNKYMACPICGGKDRFRFDDLKGEGTYYCNRCGAGNGVKLVQMKTGWPMRRVLKEIEHMAGVIVEKDIVKDQEIDPEKRKALLNKVWAEAKPISPDDPAAAYLYKRTGLKQFPSVLRYHSNLYHAEIRQYLPALVAKVTDTDNKAVNIHRTYLTDRPVQKKKMMQGPIPHGSAIRLMPYENAIGIAEGIETAISAYSIFSIPTWAGISANIMERWVPPKDAEEIWIFGDNDHSFTGQLAAYKLAFRLADSGRKVRVAIPKIGGADWNDVLTLYGSEEARKKVLEFLPNAT